MDFGSYIGDAIAAIVVGIGIKNRGSDRKFVKAQANHIEAQEEARAFMELSGKVAAQEGILTDHAQRIQYLERRGAK